jgi:hypothetical protein
MAKVLIEASGKMNRYCEYSVADKLSDALIAHLTE